MNEEQNRLTQRVKKMRYEIHKQQVVKIFSDGSSVPVIWLDQLADGSWSGSNRADFTGRRRNGTIAEIVTEFLGPVTISLPRQKHQPRQLARQYLPDSYNGLAEGIDY